MSEANAAAVIVPAAATSAARPSRRWARRLELPRQEPRALLDSDRKLVARELNLRCRESDRGTVSFSALRLRAVVLLAACSALRIGECVALDVAQLIDSTGSKLKLRSIAYLRGPQSKGRREGDHQWDSAGTFLISDEARAALRALILDMKRRGWVSWPPVPGEPLFIGVRGNGAAGAGRHRLAIRTLQWQWHQLQLRAGVVDPYHFHCLRHDAMTRASEACHGNAKVLARYGRCDVLTAMKYVHPPAHALEELRNRLFLAR